jgi:phage FluMu protein Com
MPRTIQCHHCGIVLNLPAGAKAGKRLRCPRCKTRFAISESQASSASTMPGEADATPMSALELKPPGLQDEPPVPTAEGDLRDTFDLPLLSGREAEHDHAVSGPDVADAAALMADRRPSQRRTTAAEARARARRCITCGGIVPQGMSICVTCGTDQETGLRVGLEDDLAPAPPPPPQGPPIHVASIGGLCIAASLLLLVLSVIGSTRGQSAIENVAWLCLASVAVFGIFASVQFIRGKSSRLLMLALTLGVIADVMTLIALPIFEAFALDNDKIATRTRPEDPSDSSLQLKPLEDRIDTNRIALGVSVILVYALLSMYLISPAVKKFIHSHSDRGP